MLEEEGGRMKGAGSSRGRRRVGVRRNEEGDLDERAAVAAADEAIEERAGQSGGWATLTLSCFLLGFKICKVQYHIGSLCCIALSLETRFGVNFNTH